jgi:hypothetical protein
MAEKRMSIKTNFRHLNFTLFVFCLPVLLFMVILLTSYYDTGELQLSDSASKSAVYFGLVCLITLPGFLLHCHYYLRDKHKSLKFEDTHIEVSNQSQTYRVYTRDIQKVKIYSLAWSRRLPWFTYGYTEVLLNNGDRLKFTNLLFDTTSSRNYFKSTNTTVEQLEDFYPWIN